MEQRADDIQTHDYGTLRLQSSLSMEQRLYQIHSHIVNMISMFTPDEIAIEEPFLGHGSSQYITPAFAIGQAQAAVLIAATSQNIPIFRYSPTQVKSSVADHGTATKAQVQAMVRMMLSIGEPSIGPDAADALAIALCHLRQREVKEILNQTSSPP